MFVAVQVNTGVITSSSFLIPSTVLLNAIKKGGSSIRDFKNISGNKGYFQRDFKVYERENLNCKSYKCKGIIKRKVISNRSTFFCNSCQK